MLPSRLLLVSLALASAATLARSQTVLFHDDFESGSAQWTIDSPWHVADTSTSSCLGAWTPAPSGTHCLWFGVEAHCSFQSFPFDFRYATLATPLVLPTDAARIVLEFSTGSVAENGDWDTRDVEVSSNGGASWIRRDRGFNSTWRTRSVDLSQYAGQSVLVRFAFWEGDGLGNDTIGWLIDDVTIRTDRDSFTGDACSPNFANENIPYACPCTNPGAPGHGCGNSFDPNGALLVGAGVSSIGADSTQLSVTGVSNTTVTFFQRRVVAPLAINATCDGLLCGSNPSVRIGSVAASGNAATYPGPGQLPISVRGGVVANDERLYQVIYRNPPAFCTSSTFNTSNAVTATWRP